MTKDQQRLADYLRHVMQAIDRIGRYAENLHYPQCAAEHTEFLLAFSCQMRNAVAHG